MSQGRFRGYSGPALTAAAVAALGAPFGWITAATFTQPAVGSTVSVSFRSTTGMFATQQLNVFDGAGNGGRYAVSSVTDGVTAVLSYRGGQSGSAAAGTVAAGAVAVTTVRHIQLTYFADGSDGAFTAGASGTTALTSDVPYSSIGGWTNGSTAVIRAASWRIFCSGRLDLSNAPANAIANSTPIQLVGGAGGAAATAGGAGANPGNANLGGGTAGGAGGTGTTTTGGNGVNGNATGNAGLGGNGGLGATGGTGAAGGNAAGTGGTGGTGTSTPFAGRVTTDLLRGTALYLGGAGGGGGGAGGGTGAVAGPGGGGGGGGNGVLWLAANEIYRDGTTAAGAISCTGGTGGTGGTTATNTGGGGGGGAGGGGGWIYLIYNVLSGSAQPFIYADGGVGGVGGSGLTTGLGGASGPGGNAGRISLVNIGAQTVTTTTGTAGSAGNAAIGTAGGTPGGTAGTNHVML